MSDDDAISCRKELKGEERGGKKTRKRNSLRIKNAAAASPRLQIAIARTLSFPRNDLVISIIRMLELRIDLAVHAF